jgi:hypothetical protein
MTLVEERDMKSASAIRLMVVLVALSAAAVGFQALARDTHAAAGRKCPRGVQPCSAAQVGLPCSPSNLNVICSAQVGGGYCCLAYAP